MSFDCINPNTVENYGKYRKQYAGNLEYVTEGLLDILNKNILKDELKDTPFNLLDDKCTTAIAYKLFCRYFIGRQFV